MRKLYFLRHAKSCWADPSLDDFERPLNGRGRRNARQMAKYIAKAGIRPALVLVSAARRTRATLEIIESRLKGVATACEEELYEAGKAQLLDRLHRLDDRLPSVMVIGHNPGLERLVASLIDGHGDTGAVERLSEKFPTGTLAVLETGVAHWAELGPGTCALVDFVRPKDLGDED